MDELTKRPSLAICGQCNSVNARGEQQNGNILEVDGGVVS